MEDDEQLENLRVQLSKKFYSSKRAKTSTRQTDLDKYNLLFKDVSNFESFEHFNNKIIEEDTLKQLQQKYPDSYAFSTKEPLSRELSLNERLLEHAFEELYHKKADLAEKRKLSYRTKSPILSKSKMESRFTPRYFRNLRTRIIQNTTIIPNIRYPSEDSKLFQKEIRLSIVPRNTKEHVESLILDYYNRRLEQLKLLKYKYMYRWARQTMTVESLDRTESEFTRRVTRIEKEFDFVSSRLVELNIDGSVSGEASVCRLTEDDFCGYMRNLMYRLSVRRKTDLLCQKVKWMSHTKRFQMFNKASEFYTQLDNPCVPQMHVHLKDIEGQLFELQDSFDLRNLTVDGGEEFLFTIKKRFNAVFLAQVDGMKFDDYPLHEVNTKTIDQYFMDVVSKDSQKSQSSVQFSLKKVYLKRRSDEEKNEIENFVEKNKELFGSVRGYCRQQIQGIVLKEVAKNDKQLQNEIGFLRENDVTYARKRLEELVSTHFPRAYVKAEEKRKISFEGGKTTLNKLFSVYMLRFIRVREFRKKMLDILNYFQSIKRTLSMDMKGFSLKEDRMRGFVAKSFPESDDLIPKEKDEILKMREMNNRNDEFHLENNRNLFVRDSNGIFIVYDAAIEELEKRDDFLLKLGSYFIKKSAMEESEYDIDRNTILEDLYESETWFQDGKRKVVERYFEAYQHCSDPQTNAELARVIVQLILLEPEVDFSSKYFTESYASEIIALELHHTLLKDVISTCIQEERVIMKSIWRHDVQLEEDLFGYPDKFLVDKSKTGRFSTKLLPGSSVIGYIDFYESICKVGKIYKTMKICLNEMVKAFDIKNSIMISSLKRLLCRNVLVEWKMLTEEEKIQQRVQLKYSPTRKKIESHLLLKNAESLISVIEQINKDESFDKYLFSGSEKSSVETEGGFLLKEDEFLHPKKAQIFANAVEMVILLKNVLDQLHETDVLSSYFEEQKRLLSNQGDNGDDVSPTLDGNKFANLAVCDFEESIGEEFDFSCHKGLRESIQSNRLFLLRHAFQFQLTHKIVLGIVVRYNQILMDDYFISSHDNTFVTSFRDYNIERTDVVGNFLEVSDFVGEHLERIKLEYSNRARNISDGEEEFLDLRLREIKCQLVNVYCAEVFKSVYCQAQKLQIIDYLQQLRRILKLTKKENQQTYVLGKPKDEIIDTIKAFREQGITKPTCMMTSDGNVIKPFYIPHYLQIMRMHGMLLDTTGSRVMFSNAMKLVYNNYILVLLLSVKSQLKRRTIDNLMNPQFLGFEDIKKIENQVTSLKEMNEPSNVEKLMRSIIDVLYHKILITLEVLKRRVVLEGNHEATRNIQLELDRMTSTSRKKLIKETLFEEPELWVPFRFIKEREYFLTFGLEKDQNIQLYEISNSFLLKLGNAERNNFIAEEMKIELELDDLLAEDKKKVYTTTDSENALQVQKAYCQRLINLEQLKRFFFKQLVDCKRSFDDPEVLEDIFLRVIEKEANRLYDRIIQNYNQEMKKKYLSSSKNVKQMKFREKKKMELLEKKIELLKEQINKLLILEMVKRTREECSEMISELKLSPISQTEEQLETGKLSEVYPIGKKDISKYELFKEFLYNILRKGVLTKSKSSGTTITMLQSELEDAIDDFAQKLATWKIKEIAFCRNSRNIMVNRYKRVAFLNQQKYDCAKYNHMIDKQSFKRRIEAEVVDKNFDLVFRVASVDRVNKHLEEQLNSIKEIAKNEVKKEYIDLVRSLYKEMLVVNEKYGSYKSQFYKELQNRFKQVKKETVQKCKKKPSEFHKKAVRVMKKDNKYGKLKTIKYDSNLFVTKLRVLHKLRMMAVKSKYENKIEGLEAIIEKNRKSFWGNKTKSEEREQILRQELVKIQNELSNAQMEVERLKKHLDSQKKSKREFTQWKVKNKKVIDELYKKVQRLEKWNSYNLDIEQLLLEKDNLEKEVQKYSKLKEKMNKQSRIIEQKTDVKVRELGRKLLQEKRLKEQAFQKLDYLQNRKIESQFEQKYYDAMSELKLSRNETIILKNILKTNGLSVPEFDNMNMMGGGKGKKRAKSSTLPNLSKKKSKLKRRIIKSAKPHGVHGRDMRNTISSRPVTVSYHQSRKKST